MHVSDRIHMDEEADAGNDQEEQVKKADQPGN